MASTPTLTLSPTDTVLRLLTSAISDLSITSPADPATTNSSLTLASGALTGPNTIAKYLAPRLFAREYSPLEQAEIGQWLSLSAEFESAGEGDKKKFLDTLNAHLKTRATLLGEVASVADVVVYVRVRGAVAALSPEQRTGGEDGGLRHLVRWVDFVQNAPATFGGVVVPESEKVPVDVTDVRTVVKAEEPPAKEKKEGGAAAAAEGKKEKKKEKKGKGGEEVKAVVEKGAETVKEKVGKVVAAAGEAAGSATATVAAAAAEAGPAEAGKKENKKEKKAKAPKAPAAKKEEPALSPSLIDLRVGHILQCVPHPNADSLYMSTISCGDAADSAYTTPTPDHPEYPPTRVVLSGLRGKVPIEEMRGRKVVVVCNLKPANMRGIKSSAMVLAASTAHGAADERVELVTPPPTAAPGERVYFEGYGAPAEDGQLPQLNPKNKVFETLGAGFATTDDCGVAFDGAKVFTGEEGEPAAKSLNKGVGRLVVKSGGACTVQSLKNAVVR